MSFKRFSLLVSATAALLALAACNTVQVQPAAHPPKAAGAPHPLFQPASFEALPGWKQDDLRQAWPAFIASCSVLVRKPDWKEPCTVANGVDASSEPAVRTFFESFFMPMQVFNEDGSTDGLITGYYEPLLRGMHKRTGRYQTPLYAVPHDLLTIDLAGVYPQLKGMRLRGRLVGNKVVPYPSRAELVNTDALAGDELLWVDDPIEAFFLQVQGSGRVRLMDTGETVRLAYADQNGHPYKSIGRYLVDKGELTLDQASAQNIKTWFLAHPARQQELLNANPSFVFFREEKLADPSRGPKGSLGVPLTPQRSIAVDARFIPMGAPVFLDTTAPGSAQPLERLVIAQDTGGAIRNPVRADYFWGFGPDAGERAGKMKQRGRMWALLPKEAVQSASASPPQ